MRFRRRLRSFVRFSTIMWAVLWVGGGLGALSTGTGGETVLGTLAALVFYLGFGLTPLVAHVLYARRNPLPERPRTLAGQPVHRHPLLRRLRHIREAGQELHLRGWLSPGDFRALSERLDRLQELVIADEGSVALGGRPSDALAQEIDQLGARVIGLLDAAIDSSTVAPGDSDLDARLQHQFDALRSRREAIGELEQRQQPG